MTVPPRLAPLLAEYDFTSNRLLRRLSGPTVDSGDDVQVEVEPLTDAELLWEPVPGAWTLRRQTDGPGGLGATRLVGAGEWGHDGGRPHPWPPPVTSIGWRINHVAKTLAGRADHTDGTHTHTEASDEPQGTAAGAVAGLTAAVAAWRATLLGADDAALDTVGYSTYPNGSDSEETFLDVVWWMNQEVVHHGAEIALLRDLYIRLG
ncbi:DinB family protein [Cellulomonas humilata]|uniref:DinB-like domain-containing protein n=1 Tax=Cellulomonas humilata TaxID=144055 RepID=A0ABU0EJT8_9CELL|nr:DinB family protein [Cellulomonas humilata]MDQ0375558.1 hypothetical protein [Cellulomonas humilata]